MDDKQLEQSLPYVEHCEVSAEMKMQILRDLWSTLQIFADHAWELGPLHDAIQQKPPTK